MARLSIQKSCMHRHTNLFAMEVLPPLPRPDCPGAGAQDIRRTEPVKGKVTTVNKAPASTSRDASLMLTDTRAGSR